MESVLTKNQTKTLGKVYPTEKGYEKIVATVRYDDICGNGHNTLSVTAYIWKSTKNGHHVGRDPLSCGCNHSDVVRHFPELQNVVKFHLCSTDGPLHYQANTQYHVENGKYDAARESAIWPDASSKDFRSPDLNSRLLHRLPKLMEEFRTAIENLGFTY